MAATSGMIIGAKRTIPLGALPMAITAHWSLSVANAIHYRLSADRIPGSPRHAG